MSSEPRWMQSIPDDFVCNYFWAFSAVILITGLISVAGFTYLACVTKTRSLFALLAVKSLLLYGLIFFLYVCLYLLCSRSLLRKETN